LKQIIFRVYGAARPRDVGNYSGDLERILHLDVPALLDSVTELKKTRASLQREIAELRAMHLGSAQVESESVDASKILSGEGYDIPHYGE
jgi:hypothetical protein